MINNNLDEAKKAGFILSTTHKNCEDFLSFDGMPMWAKSSIEELIENENWTELNAKFWVHIPIGLAPNAGPPLWRTSRFLIHRMAGGSDGFYAIDRGLVADRAMWSFVVIPVALRLTF